jgi:hypothetical protein
MRADAVIRLLALAAAACHPPTALSGAERARARAFLAPINGGAGPGVHLRSSPWIGAADDIDGDGRADCWVSYTDDELGVNLMVWPGCDGRADAPGAAFRDPRIGMAALAVPARLATPTWLHWLARRLRADGSINCVGDSIAACAPPGPEWRWVIAAGSRERVALGWRGTVAADWQPVGHRTVAGVLIMPAAAEILLDADFDRGAGPFPCGGLDISLDDGGILASDPGTRRWKWLFRGLPDRGGFVARSITCVAGVVVATARAPDALVVVDPVTGRWWFLADDRRDLR